MDSKIQINILEAMNRSSKWGSKWRRRLDESKLCGRWRLGQSIICGTQRLGKSRLRGGED